MNGFLCIDKPCGISSFAVIKKIRHQCNQRRVGHCGTLDPAASGLLVCALGNATRLLPYLPAEPKRYLFRVRFGSTTDTLDREGVVTESGRPLPDAAQIEQVLPRFIGHITQQPPRFSAVKINGVRAYRLARQQQEFEVAEREVTIHAFEMTDYDAALGCADFDVTCSGGTYVRSLARDLAQAVHTCGYALAIRRVRIGAFTLEQACPWEECDGTLPARVIDTVAALSHLPCGTPDDAQIRALAFGQSIRLPLENEGALPVLLVSAEGELIAVARRQDDGLLHPIKVFTETCRS